MKPRVVLDHPSLVVHLDTERGADGRARTFLWGTGPDVALVVPVWDDGTVTLVSVRRHGMRARSIEAPGGHIEPKEKPASAARRELREEAGIAARRVKRVLTFFPAAKLLQRFHVYVATGLRAVEAALEEDEDIRTIRVPLEVACRRAGAGWVVTGPTILALHAARAHLAR